MNTENSGQIPPMERIPEEASRNTLALNPLVGIRGQDLADSAGVLFKAIVNEPKVAAEQWFSFLGELGAIVAGKSERAPQAGDRRFSVLIASVLPLPGSEAPTFRRSGQASPIPPFPAYSGSS